MNANKGPFLEEPPGVVGVLGVLGVEGELLRTVFEFKDHLTTMINDFNRL